MMPGDSEVVEKFPELRGEILEKLLSAFEELKQGKVFRGALWIVGEYSLTENSRCRSRTAVWRAVYAAYIGWRLLFRPGRCLAKDQGLPGRAAASGV